ncbi:MAG TPA: DUF4238 domain-containing protein [Bacteroides mediterraneensis]|uniref:DUF4238 domain-containing protein n=1 Tax=Bacteroides mediterraneensis TaxID=1841856 RepID=UPI0026F12E7D|nr:DUF4238 domain-containing protein [Bacteroides mediterraneensis]HJH64384.1 DUF4238 domain-containing protein [Bacteroides mediterraneensis]
MAKSEKKGETKNQHYVPQFYQRYFSKDKKNIGTYIIEREKNIPSAPIKNQSSSDYFYSENMKIENALGKMEELSKNVIDKIILNPKVRLTPNDQYTLYVFTIIQKGRTLAQANFIQEHANVILRTFLKKYCQLLRENNIENDLKDITDEVLDKILFNFKQPGLFALGTQAQLVNTCIDLKCKILINNTDIPFITSNNPVALYDQFMERMGNLTYALGSQGLQIYLPLTPKIGVMYYDPKCYKLGYQKKTYVEIIQDSDIYELNKLTALNAENILYYEPDSITEHALKQLAIQSKNSKPSSRVGALPELKSSKGVIVGAYDISMFCKLKLSFIKELPRYKAIQPQDFDPTKHQFREIAYIKDYLMKIASK